MKNPAPSVEPEPLYHYEKGKGWVLGDESVEFTDRRGNRCLIIKRAPVGNEFYVIGGDDWKMCDFLNHCENFFWDHPLNIPDMYELYKTPDNNVVTVICYGK